MFKKVLGFSALVAIVVMIAPGLVVKAKNSRSVGIDLPERDGLYDVPDHPHLKLRVFVHEGKQVDFARGNNAGKPVPPPPALTCASSSVADPDSSAVVNPAGWKLPGSWTYHLNLGSVPSTVGGANLAAISGNAYGSWLSAIHNAVAVTRGSDTSFNKAQLDSQNIIAWGRTSGSALAVSYIWYNATTGIASEVDTIMNQRFSWYWSNPATWPSSEICSYGGVYDAEDILTHELGHTFGLDDEYATSYQNNTMYGYGSTSETKKDTLTAGDETGVGALY